MTQSGDMALYLYLNDRRHAAAWIDGGPVPINPARIYRGDRGGVMTPDEIIQRSTVGVDAEAFAQLSSVLGGADGAVTMYFRNCGIGAGKGPTRPLNGTIHAVEEDSLIFCFSEVLSREVMTRFGNKVCAVEIRDIPALMSAVSRQLGVQGQLQAVQYTDSPNRSHTLKSRLDEWQAEVRAFWTFAEATEVRWVDLPPGVAVMVEDADIPLRHTSRDRQPIQLSPTALDRLMHSVSSHSLAALLGAKKV